MLLRCIQVRVLHREHCDEQVLPLPPLIFQIAFLSLVALFREESVVVASTTLPAI